MSFLTTRTIPRSPIHGVTQIVRFNWPKYVVASFVVLAGVAAVSWVQLPGFAPPIILTFVAITLFWSMGSLVASHWIYDCSQLSDWRWLPTFFEQLGIQPGRWANLHAGFDDTTVHLISWFPKADGVVVDFYDPQWMTESSIERAQGSTQTELATRRGKAESLPFQDKELNCVFLLFAAHELRTHAMRVTLFREAHRVLAPSGRVMLVEHARDGWNWLAFGPGALHFYSRNEWLRVVRESGFVCVTEGWITPFVRYFVLESPQ